MKEKALEIIERYNMIEKGDKIYVALSGGGDSVALLHFLMDIRKEFNLELGIIHVNHLLRGGDAEKDDFYVRQLATKYRLPIHSEQVDVGEYARIKRLSIEEAARFCRYICFSRAAKKLNIQKVGIAHTRDDNSETVLMRLLKGTGLKGLRAIQPIMEYEGVRFIRPLIDCTDADIRKYLKVKKLRYRIDITNRYIKYYRNKIRHELIPVLEQDYNPKVREALARLSETAFSDYDFLNQATMDAFPTIVQKEKDGLVVFNTERFKKAHSAIQYRLLVKAMEKIAPGSYFPFGHWTKIRAALEKGNHFTIFVGRQLQVEVRRLEIILRAKGKQSRYEYYVFNNEKVLLKECDMVVNLKEVEKEEAKSFQPKPNVFSELLDIDKLEFPLLIRNRRNGDRMQLFGERRDKKVKDLLIDKKVPFFVRDEIPLVLSKRKIVWCWGVGSSESYRPSADTKRYLQLSITNQPNGNG